MAASALSSRVEKDFEINSFFLAACAQIKSSLF